MTTASLTAYPSEQEQLGFFRIFATPPGGYRREITLFRDAPVTPSSVSFGDPFTEQTAQLSLPQVTVFDTPGTGDLAWLVPDADIDIVFQNTGGYGLQWSWEGYIASYSMSLSGTDSLISVDLKGALFALDNYLAIPRFPKRPIPFEILMAQSFDQSVHPCRLGRFRVLWPANWSLRVPERNDPVYLAALKPWGVTTGDRWTGFTSRGTGSWEPTLSGHIQSLLLNMFSEGGSQWSVRNRGLRRPELYLRRIPESNSDRIVEIQLGAPGVRFDGSRDFTQRADVVYGTGTDEAQVAYSGIEISPDGKNTRFLPFASSARAYPRTNNPMYDKALTPKEAFIQFQPGIDELAARKVATGQLQRFSEPGITGNITLTTDPRYSDGSICPRMLMKSGMTLRIKGLLGVVEGVLAHVTAAAVDFRGMTISLTYDTKYRDALTVEEVQARTRDSLNPVHLLQNGKYQNTIQDSVLPWSYNAGSGMIPIDSKDFFLKKVGAHDTFPYENLTTKYPPSNPAYKSWYIRVNPTNPADASKNWAGEGGVAIPIRMAQSGTIRLTQLAAYDKNGHVMPVKFHVSIYKGHTVDYKAMPRFPHDPKGEPPAPNNETWAPPLPYLPARQVAIPGVADKDRPVIPTTYTTNQYHPMWIAAWEEKQPNGFNWPWGGPPSNQGTAQMVAPGADIVVGWGNYYEPAGYSPGRFSKGANRTGILEDASTWNWDLNGYLNFDSDENNSTDPYAGILFIMIYCDDQGPDPVYFMGRLARSEPGQS